MTDDNEELERLDRVAAAAEKAEGTSEWLEKIGWKPSQEQIEEDLEILQDQIESCENCGENLCDYHRTLWEALGGPEKR